MQRSNVRPSIRNASHSFGHCSSIRLHSSFDSCNRALVRVRCIHWISLCIIFMFLDRIELESSIPSSMRSRAPSFSILCRYVIVAFVNISILSIFFSFVRDEKSLASFESRESSIPVILDLGIVEFVIPKSSIPRIREFLTHVNPSDSFARARCCVRARAWLDIEAQS